MEIFGLKKFEEIYNEIYQSKKEKLTNFLKRMFVWILMLFLIVSLVYWFSIIRENDWIKKVKEQFKYFCSFLLSLILAWVLNRKFDKDIVFCNSLKYADFVNNSELNEALSLIDIKSLCKVITEKIDKHKSIYRFMWLILTAVMIPILPKIFKVGDAESFVMILELIVLLSVLILILGVQMVYPIKKSNLILNEYLEFLTQYKKVDIEKYKNNWKKINNDEDIVGSKCRHSNAKSFKQFIKSNDIVEYKKDIVSGISVIRFFENGGCSRGKKQIFIKKELPSGFVNHEMFFRTKNKKVIFTSQVYKLSKRKIKQIFKENFNDKFELKIYKSRESWYNPKKTKLFSIMLKNE